MQSSGSDIEAWSSWSSAPTRDLDSQGLIKTTVQKHPNTGSTYSDTEVRHRSTRLSSWHLCQNIKSAQLSITMKMTFLPLHCRALQMLASGSDVEMPSISKILAQKEACESQHVQKRHPQQLKLAAIAQQQQKRVSTSTGRPLGVEQDLDDDGPRCGARYNALCRARRRGHDALLQGILGPWLATRHSCTLPVSQLRPSSMMSIPLSQPPMNRLRSSWRPLRSPHSFPHSRERWHSGRACEA